MRLFFVNTDAISFGGVSRHDEWLRRKIILTAGEPRYKTELARIPKGARVLVYVNGVGVVAVGETTSDDVQDVGSSEAVNPSAPGDPSQLIEYHRRVSWLLDLRGDPISWIELVGLLGQGPLKAVSEVHSGKEALLLRLALLEASPTADTETYLRVASELQKYGPVARPIGTSKPVRTTSTGTQYTRDPKVRAWTLQRAQGCCELCDQPAPFVDERQLPYLESHHITMLADHGADTPENTAALCANCHRELHVGADRIAKTERLRLVIGTKEAGASAKASPKPTRHS